MKLRNLYYRFWNLIQVIWNLIRYTVHGYIKIVYDFLRSHGGLVTALAIFIIIYLGIRDIIWLIENW